MVKRIAGRIDGDIDPNSVCRDPVLRDLFAVETIPQAMRRWGKSETAVRNAIMLGKLDSRLAGGTWLITVHSLIRLWGKPKSPPDFEGVELSLPMWQRKSA